jgi:hypothetical protein
MDVRGVLLAVFVFGCDGISLNRLNQTAEVQTSGWADVMGKFDTYTDWLAALPSGVTVNSVDLMRDTLGNGQVSEFDHLSEGLQWTTGWSGCVGITNGGSGRPNLWPMDFLLAHTGAWLRSPSFSCSSVAMVQPNDATTAAPIRAIGFEVYTSGAAAPSRLYLIDQNGNTIQAVNDWVNMPKVGYWQGVILDDDQPDAYSWAWGTNQGGTPNT